MKYSLCKCPFMKHWKEILFGASCALSVLLLLAFFPSSPFVNAWDINQTAWVYRQHTPFKFTVGVSDEPVANAWFATPLKLSFGNGGIELVPDPDGEAQVIFTKKMLQHTSPKDFKYIFAHELGHGRDFLLHDNYTEYWKSAMFISDRSAVDGNSNPYTKQEGKADIMGLKLMQDVGYDYTVGPGALSRLIHVDKEYYEYDESLARERQMQLYIDDQITPWERIKFALMR